MTDADAPLPVAARRRWPVVLGAVLSVAMVAGLGRQLFGVGASGLAAAPGSVSYFLLFALLYAAPPAFDYWIFRRLWALPLSGLSALAKKRVANEVLVDYAGEAYFYSWARARAQITAAPFAAVKDVTILSAIAGNAVTLAVVALALPFAGELLNAAQMRLLFASGGVLVVASLPFLIFSRRVFSLARRTLWGVFGVHALRLVSVSALLALAWAAALPGVGVGTWLLLAAGRLLIFRLPLLPNKDLLFANAAILLIGNNQPLVDLIAFTAALTLLVHVVLLVAFGAGALVSRSVR